MTTTSQATLVHTIERFIESIQHRDFDEMKGCLAPEIRFRALVPPGLREAADPSGAVQHYQRWFAGADHFELMKSEVEPTSDRVRLRYRIRLHDEDGWALIDQSGYASGPDKIEELDLACSGFRPVDPPPNVQQPGV